MSPDNLQPPEDPSFDEWVREQQAEAHWERQLTAAYAEGRKDEREEWLPVLEALSNLADLYDTDEGCRSTPEYIAARAAIARVTGSNA